VSGTAAQGGPAAICAFLCNICGTEARVPQVDRIPGPLCPGCRASTRFRLIAHALCTRVFGCDAPLFAAPPNDLRGLGLSDAHPYARVLARKYPGYVNSFYHAEPRLDIAAVDPAAPDPAWAGRDWLIAADVFEHVPPPVGRAFAGAHALLRPGGVLLFSVPVEPVHREHFPDLHDWRIEGGPDAPDGPVLVNRRADGAEERFWGLRFHGGQGQVLEMRAFSEASAEAALAAAGFVAIERVPADVPAHGIAPVAGLSGLWVARRAEGRGAEDRGGA
jgi:SAM-dependent methyltransferase